MERKGARAYSFIPNVVWSDLWSWMTPQHFGGWDLSWSRKGLGWDSTALRADSPHNGGRISKVFRSTLDVASWNSDFILQMLVCPPRAQGNGEEHGSPKVSSAQGS